MFGVVAPHDDELTLPIEIEGIDDAQTRLTRSPARHAEAAAKQHPDDDEDQESGDEEGDERQDDHRGFAAHDSFDLRHDRL